MRTAYELSDWQGYLTHAEIDEIQRIAKLVKQQWKPIFVNIGAGAGTSTIAVLETREDAVLISVDILASGTEVTTNEHQRLDECGEDYLKRVVRVWGDSKIVGEAWPFMIDYIFIDGDHTADGCRGDIESWFDHVREGGYMLFHDYGSPNWPDVKTVVDEMMKDYHCISVVDTLAVFKV
jgi:precorrin-6B methylase 2